MNKYERHQNRRERARRLRQVRAGQLSGRCGRKNRSDFVSLDARYAAFGLVQASSMTLIAHA